MHLQADPSGNLHNGLWGPLKPKWGYIQVFGNDQAFGCPTAATHRCWSMSRRLDPQTGLRTGVWIPNRSYTQVLGVQAAATHGCLESQPRLHTGVWSPKRAIVQVARIFLSPNLHGSCMVEYKRLPTTTVDAKGGAGPKMIEVRAILV